MMPYNDDEVEFLQSKKTLHIRKEVSFMIKNIYIIVGVAVALIMILFSGVVSANDWSGGYRYYYDGDDKYKSKLRLFGKYKDMRGHAVKFGWERQVGVIPNFTRTGTYDGYKLDNFGVMFIEQEFKF